MNCSFRNGMKLKNQFSRFGEVFLKPCVHNRSQIMQVNKHVHALDLLFVFPFPIPNIPIPKSQAQPQLQLNLSCQARTSRKE